jgi:hypothetical protein
MNNIYNGECYIQDSVRPSLQQTGFEWNKEAQYFFKTNGNYIHTVRLGLRRGKAVTTRKGIKNSPQISLQVGIKALVVEDLVSQFRQQPPTIHQLTASFGTQQLITDLSEENLDRVSQQIENTLEHKAMPLLTKYSNLKRLDALFNRHTYQHNKHVGGLLNRCFKGLVLARFSYRRRFTELYEQYLQRLDNQWAPRDAMHNFSSLYRFLKVYSLN